MTSAARHLHVPQGLGPIALLARIERRSVGIARPSPARASSIRHLGVDDGAAEEGGIEEPEPTELVESGAIGLEALALPQHGLLPAETEPGEVLEDRRLEFLARPRPVDILDAEQE